MSSKVFYPYRTRSTGIKFSLSSIADGVTRDNQNRLLFNGECPNEVELQIRVEIADDLIQSVLHDSEVKNPPVEIIVTFQSISSRKRFAAGLKNHNGIFQGSFRCIRTDWSGKLEARALVIRTNTNEKLPTSFGYAKGMNLAWSEALEIIFEKQEEPLGNYVQSLWISFKGRDNLRKYEDHMFAVDTTLKQLPVILLNSDIPNARDILDSRGTHGLRARTRDATFFMIAHQVWSSILSEIIYNLNKAAIDEQIPDPLDTLGDWERKVLTNWSTVLYPGTDSTECTNNLVDHIKRGEDLTQLLMEKLPSIIQEKLQTYRGFTGLVQEVKKQ
ncbi:hypothetical protein ACFLT7_07030 [candidate division KSB1 bacterium]